jgi:hypothetical protein
MLPNRNIFRITSILLISLSVLFMMIASSNIATVSAGGQARMQEGTDTPDDADNPGDPEEPPEEPTSVISSITQSFFHVVFHDDTISKALSNLFKKTAEAQKNDFQKEVARWSSALNELVKPAEKDQFTNVAKSGLKTAAALAPALFLLRLALYHWSKLLGDGNDTPMVVVGDWLTAGLLAVLSGPFLDLISRLGWWMCKVAAVGETRVLAANFVTLMSAPSFLSITSVIPGLVFLQSLIGIAMTFAAILAMAGLLFAFVSAQATLFVLAVLGPAISVGAVIPQMRWLRSLWLKAVVLISLLPLIAGAIFKAAVSVAGAISQGGMVLSLVRLLWLFGATGALLSLSGILAKMTLSASGEAAKKIFGVAKGLVATAALAAATGGVGAAAGGAVAASGGAATGTGAAVTGTTMSGSASAAAGTEMAHLAKAQGFNKLGTALDAVGAHKQARVAYGMGRSSDLSARQDRLQTKIDGFGSASNKTQASQSSPESSDIGFSASSSVKKDILSGFGGSPDDFRSAYSGLSTHMESAGFSPDGFASQYPQAAGMMAKTYAQSQQEIDDATAPLWETANRAGVDTELLSLLEQAKE